MIKEIEIEGKLRQEVGVECRNRDFDVAVLSSVSQFRHAMMYRLHCCPPTDKIRLTFSSVIISSVGLIVELSRYESRRVGHT